MTKEFSTRWLATLIALTLSAAVVVGQSDNRAIPVKVTATAQKSVFSPGEAIIVDIEIYNGLSSDIIVQGYSLEPNERNGETTGIQLPDIYRLPVIYQRYLKRPELDLKKIVSSPGGRRVGPGKSLVKTIDAGKWTIVDGWIKGKYQILIRVDKIDVDRYTWINVHSDPVFFEIK